MGIADRDYQRTERPSGGAFLANLTPVVKWLLILNIGIFFVDIAIEFRNGQMPLRKNGAFSIQSSIQGFHVWQFITFQFLHGNLLHLLTNSMGIFFFGPWMERWWGSRKFILFYLLCGAGGAIFFTILAYLGILPPTRLVGASAGIYGILIGVASIAPNLRVALLFPPIELSMRQLALAVLAIAAGAILFRIGGNEGGEAGHLGGAIVGYLLVRFPQVLRGRAALEIVQPRVTRPRPLPKLRPRSDLEQQQDTAVDMILDKISKDGFQSLTQAEKDLLHKVSNQKRSS